MSSAPPLQALDLMGFPFQGAQVIEASAGTGKTWTLASLYLRLVLGHGRRGGGLLPPQILVMTFTEAATAELRDRIRRRLVQAADFFREEAGAVSSADPFLVQLREAWPRGEWPARALQLELAVQWMDEAAIHTIHGWSHRALREHAFDSASLFEQDKVDDPQALKLVAAGDYWRRWIYPLEASQSLAFERLASTPAALLECVDRHVARRERKRKGGPALAADLSAPTDFEATIGHWSAWASQLQRALRAAHSAWRTHRAALEEQLSVAMARDLKGTSFKTDKRTAYLGLMRAWSSEAFGSRTLESDELRRFSAGNLRGALKKGGIEPVDTHGVFALLQAAFDLDAAEPPSEPLLDHAAACIGELYESRKAALAQFDFPDLLTRLHAALHAPGSGLAAALRVQYPVALIDEFQDTDRWQYASFQRIYLDPQTETSAALLMIGDPKQAIYGFRGADLDTYVTARNTADCIHTLTGNYRSTQSLVAAVNHVFTSAVEPFGSIPYEPVTAQKDVPPLLQRDGGVHPAMTVWHTPGDEPVKAAEHLALMAAVFATRIIKLLGEGLATPADVAVLVRSGKEARAIRAALDQRGLRSVYLSDRDSVYGTREAFDLWTLLRAVNAPRTERFVRAALGTRSFGLPLATLDALFADERALEQQVERFTQWQSIWQRQGFLAMLYAVLHEQAIPSRLLAQSDGERRLTNLLHLGDLLQQASLGLQGEGAVVRHLADRLRDSATAAGGETGADAAQMRLETDAHLVKVVTLHKSKGLQYPVVFLPFASGFMTDKDDDLSRRAEDVRLLYVALTRAERAVFVGATTLATEFNKDSTESKSALGQLLGRRNAQDLRERLATWAQCADIVVAPLPEADGACYAGPPAAPGRRTAEVPQRRHASAWRSASFSSLTRRLEPPVRLTVAPTEADERYSDSQTDNPPETRDAGVGLRTDGIATNPYAAFPRGARYGDLLHVLLEWQVQQRWPILDPTATATVPVWDSLLRRRCDALGITPEHRALLTEWIIAIGRCPLGIGVTLHSLDPARTWAEMGFLLTTHGATARAIDALISRHVLPGQSRNALQPQALEGLLTGFLDLVFEHDGRYYVLDYKSNYLPAGYAQEQLAEAILGHRYDLQYTLYLLALHRLLKARLATYDYDRHMGGALYLFVRGIDEPGHGMHHDLPPRALIERLDDLLAGRAAPVPA